MADDYTIRVKSTADSKIDRILRDAGVVDRKIAETRDAILKEAVRAIEVKPRPGKRIF
jgi:hypothetical protein